MVKRNTDEVDFDDVVNYKTSRKVAATAFVSPDMHDMHVATISSVIRAI